MGLLDFFKKAKESANTPEKENDRSMTKKLTLVADQLTKLGYFKYADPADLEQLHREIAEGLLKDHYLASVEGPGPNFKVMDPRHYALDGEDLYEQGGIVDAFRKMAPFFEKLQINMSISDELEDYDLENEWLNYEITINGKKYVIFRNFPGYGWDEAAQRFADVVNDQLMIQGSQERLYLINGGNDGRAVFLTEELHALVSRYIKDVRERPLATEEWCRVMSVEYVQIT